MDSTTPSNVRLFRRPRTAPADRPALMVPQGEKMALYPLAEDVLISLPLFKVILLTLEFGSAEDRAALVSRMRSSYEAPFVT